MTISGLRALGWAAMAAGLLHAGPASAETVLNVVMQAPLRTLDPHLSTAQIVRTHGFMVFDTLLGMDADYKPQPQMADYQVSDDGLTYTFTLRDGLTWHDGSPVAAEDCVASLKRWAENDPAGRKMMEYVASIETTSDKVLVLTLARPFGHVLDLLAKPSPVPPFMMPKRLAETPRASRWPRWSARARSSSSPRNTGPAIRRSMSGTRITSRAPSRPAGPPAARW